MCCLAISLGLLNCSHWVMNVSYQPALLQEFEGLGVGVGGKGTKGVGETEGQVCAAVGAGQLWGRELLSSPVCLSS